MADYWIPTARFAASINLEWQSGSMVQRAGQLLDENVPEFQTKAQEIFLSIRAWAFRARVISGLLLSLIVISLVTSSIPVYSVGTGAGGAPQLFVFFLGATLSFGYLGINKSNVLLMLRSRYVLRAMFIISILSTVVYALMQLIWAVLFCGTDSPALDFPGILNACQQYIWLIWLSFSLAAVTAVGTIAIYVCLERLWVHDSAWAALLQQVSVVSTRTASSQTKINNALLVWIVHRNATETRGAKVKYYLPTFEDLSVAAPKTE